MRAAKNSRLGSQKKHIWRSFVLVVPPAVRRHGVQKKKGNRVSSVPLVRWQSAYLAAGATGAAASVFFSAVALWAFFAACFLATVFLAAGAALVAAAGAVTATGAVAPTSFAAAGAWANDTAATLESNTVSELRTIPRQY